jgi:ribonuclease G
METPIFEQFGVQRDIRRMFGRIVTIRSGVYLYIEHTEAMHVIDVNSGNHIKAGTGQEDTALQVNIESAKEIARQLRLRDMGGIVIVDFVDMAKAEHRRELYEVMTEEMKKDKARHTILPLSKFGLMQITRQRVRPAVEVDVQEKCPFCDGTGTIKSSLVVVDEIESNLRYLESSQQERKLTVVTHPYIQAYLTKGFKSIRRQWQRKYKMRLTINPSESYNLLEYKFFTPDGEEVQM